MTQEDVIDPSIAEEPNTSDQRQVGDSAEIQMPAEPPIAEPQPNEEEEANEGVAEEELDADECEVTQSDAAQQTESAHASPSSSVTRSAQTDADDRNELEKQPYDFDHSAIQIAIQFLPDDGNSNGRIVVVGVRSHLDAPILRCVRLNEIGRLPPLVNTLLDELKRELPARGESARAAFEKKKEVKAKRKAELEASRARASQRGKKTAKASTLSTAPTSNSAATDNRPRPEVNVPKTSQQQMGLL